MNVVSQLKSTQPKPEVCASVRPSRFVLTRRNQKGQMAIFVALIFQVIFVFFALLINVGLLVHHKINLQQSADLAAYYGAMKQAEVMNTIAHINFQIRQNWKLLTWRYRILGTFGFQGGSSGNSQAFPFELMPTGGFQFRARAADGLISGPQCADGLGVQDIPFFCIGHPGFSGWPGNESVCRVDCSTFSQARNISKIPRAGDAITPGGGDFSRAANTFISQANTANNDRCQLLGKYGAVTLARFMASYIYENRYRTKTIEMLAKNLSLPTNEIRDIEGALILDGVKTTFKNNLTEANLTGLNNDIDATLSTWTGLGSGDQCKFVDGFSGKEFLKRIEFDYINYFIHNCTVTGVADVGSWAYQPAPVYGDDQGMGPAFAGVPQEVKDIAATLLGGGGSGKQNLHTVGFEKNPHCVEYYAVKATSEPNIPFLPLKKIKLYATAVAKPFGGSIGPWYGQSWPSGADQSTIVEDPEQNVRVDNTLPFRRINGAEDVQNIKKSVYYQPNFALFVGDRKGVRDGRYIASYHSALAVRNIGSGIPFGSFDPNTNSQNRYANSGNGWPSLTEDWKNIDNPLNNAERSYDSLAGLDRATRYLEISAIAPNQFDLTFYSIDPDFYNNYYKKLYKGFDKISAATGMGPANRNQLRGDFGSHEIDPNATSTEVADPKAFSVKDQILIKNIIFDTNMGSGSPYGKYSDAFKFLASVQSSLLTGWTFLNFSDYKEFPNSPVDDANNTMSFGQCNNEWNNTQAALSSKTSEDNFKSPTNEGLPPAVGNCVTGGRTGYSVKIISPAVIKQNSNPSLANPIPSEFLNF